MGQKKGTQKNPLLKGKIDRATCGPLWFFFFLTHSQTLFFSLCVSTLRRCPSLALPRQVLRRRRGVRLRTFARATYYLSGPELKKKSRSGVLFGGFLVVFWCFSGGFLVVFWCFFPLGLFFFVLRSFLLLLLSLFFFVLRSFLLLLLSLFFLVLRSFFAVAFVFAFCFCLLFVLSLLVVLLEEDHTLHCLQLLVFCFCLGVYHVLHRSILVRKLFLIVYRPDVID